MKFIKVDNSKNAGREERKQTQGTDGIDKKELVR